MAKIVLGIGTSHGAQTHIPASQWPLWGAKDEHDPRFNFAELLKRVKPDIEQEITPEKMQERCDASLRAQKTLDDLIRRAAPGVVVIIGDDQYEQFLDDNMPMFCIYRGSAPMPRKRSGEGNAPPDVVAARKAQEAKSTGPDVYQPAPDLADHLIRCLVNEGFDIACSAELKPEIGLGHAFSNVCRNTPAVAQIPMVPVMVNTFFPPNQPTPWRAYALGQALGAAITAWDSDKTVGVIASGGLSHQILDEELDRRLLDGLREKDDHSLCSLPRDKLQLGTSESLNWVVAGGALEPMEMTLVDYIPAYRSRGGTGTGLAFAYWT